MKVLKTLGNFPSSPWAAAILVSLLWITVGWLMGYLRSLDRMLGVELPQWLRLPGILLISLGGIVVITCAMMLSTRGIGTLDGSDRLLPREFVASGPFQFVRNPMSLGGTILMTGIAMFHHSSLGLALAAMLFLLFHLVVVYREEPGLARRFGESYRTYLRHVPRWIPRLTPWQQREPD